jgi:hypothetical protein
MMDTGAAFNIIDVSTAKQITKADTNPTMSIRGVSGRSGGMSQAGRFNVDFAGLRLPVTSMDSMDLSRSGGVAGFLGYPTLSQLVIQIDYRDNLVDLKAAPDAKRQD